VISSHVLKDLEALCDRVLVLDRGRVLYDGGVDGLKRREEGRYRLRFKGDGEALVRALTAGGVEVEGAAPFLSVRVAGDAGPGLIWAAAAETGCQVRELRLAADSLEDAFLRLLGREGG